MHSMLRNFPTLCHHFQLGCARPFVHVIDNLTPVDWVAATWVRYMYYPVFSLPHALLPTSVRYLGILCCWPAQALIAYPET